MNVTNDYQSLLSGAWSFTTDPVFWSALLLVAGSLMGEAVARASRLPRVIGYTLAGLAAGWVGLGAHTPLAGTPRLIVDVALALLLFEIGSRVRLRWLRHNPALIWTSASEAVLSAIAVYFALLWLGLEARVAAGCAVLAVPASAAVAGRVALELGAEGQITNRMTMLTALNTLYAGLVLTFLGGWLAAEESANLWHTVATLAYSFFGSLAMAGILAFVVAAVARRLDLRNESAVLLVLGLVVLSISASRALGLSTLLVPLLGGIVLRNTTERPWVWPRHFGTAGGVLVLMLFVIVGASWSPAIIAAGGFAGLVLLLARGLAKGLGVMVFSRWAGASARQGLALAITLTPLSATTLVMLADLHGVAPQTGALMAPIVLSAVMILEIIGPVAVQMALILAGEIAPAAARQRKEAP